MHYNDDVTNFTFGTDTPEDIFVLNIARARYKQRLTLGSLNLQIQATTNGIPSQSQQTIHLTDDSVTNPAGAGTSNLGTYYNVVSGANGVVLAGTTATTQVKNSSSYGHIYPEAGIIILNASAFSQSLISEGGG